MTGAEIKQIGREIDEAMRGRRFGKIFPLSDTSFAIDFHPHAGSYLFIDFNLKTCSAYLIVRKLKELERSTAHSSAFIIQLRRRLTGRELTRVFADHNSIQLDLTNNERDSLTLLIQLRGGTPNVLLLDTNALILGSPRSSDREGQRIGDIHTKPFETETSDVELPDQKGGSLSVRFDSDRRDDEMAARFEQLAKDARKKIKTELTKRQKLLNNLENDLAAHGNADQWKIFGDLILANISTLRREGDTICLTNFFDPEMAELEIPADHNKAPSEVAESYFRKYTKARNAAIAITGRKKIVIAEIEQLKKRRDDIESAIALLDEERLVQFVSVKQAIPQISKENKKADDFTGARRFVSSDGFEILVGKKAKDNDHLTFRIAKAQDIWLHAADYPGSHVVIRNPNRNEVPTPTLLEAAQLAAFYSDARKNPKAAVNYTPKKFVNKPKRSAPGLASLSSFKTILVEPGFPDSVGKKDT